MAGKKKGKRPKSRKPKSKKRTVRPYQRGKITKKLNFDRRSPAASATLFRIGERRRGNDGRMYKVIRAGISRRWSLA